MKIPVGILGATGSVGQKFIELLKDHPWFEIKALAASERSAGKTYAEAVNWFMTTPVPDAIAGMSVSACEPGLPCKIVFSGLDSSVAGPIEKAFAEAGYIVVSNSRNHRMDEDVPLLVPEINAGHLEMVKKQKYGKGFIVTNPNCSTIGLVMALKPLYNAFGIEALHVVTMQALSGAGYPGVPSVDILDNVVPYISGEEEKMQIEPLKILGNLQNGKVEFANMKISAQCNRVHVSDGHLESVSVKLGKKAAKNELIEAWNNFSGEPQNLKLPMAPEQAVQYFNEPNYPQPRLHRMLGKGMTVSVGRLQECPLLDFKFNVLSHNTIRGAAGGAILNAELLYKKGYLDG
ncbi:MAG: aspartate-semialdehyde dehydrogenase [Calditrichae bacterium]|nr:aspartate-semialdehyde dehydrogenase [Calditrichota bacterium]MCB9059707.1 aspartate-semialdehyde dehydrogenase [Calditrichia bacterium]